MFSTKKYLPVLAAFVVGVAGAASYAVHAASTTSNTSSATQVQTTAQDPQNLDGEQADDTTAVQSTAQDPASLDGETADDAGTSTSVNANVQHEAESGPADSGPDQGEAAD